MNLLLSEYRWELEICWFKTQTQNKAFSVSNLSICYLFCYFLNFCFLRCWPNNWKFYSNVFELGYKTLEKKLSHLLSYPKTHRCWGFDYKFVTKTSFLLDQAQNGNRPTSKCSNFAVFQLFEILIKGKCSLNIGASNDARLGRPAGFPNLIDGHQTQVRNRPTSNRSNFAVFQLFENLIDGKCSLNIGESNDARLGRPAGFPNLIDGHQTQVRNRPTSNRSNFAVFQLFENLIDGKCSLSIGASKGAWLGRPAGFPNLIGGPELLKAIFGL